MKENLIFYKTTADFDNTGEVLIYKSLLNLLRAHGSVIVDDSAKTPKLFLDRIELQDSERLSSNSKFSFSLSLWMSAVKNIFSNKRVYFVTGIGAHAVKGFKAALKNIVASIYCFLLRCLGVRLIRLGMSMQISGKIAGLSEIILSKSFNHYLVRDSISLTNCRETGVKKAQLAPDLSWAYNISNFSADFDKKKIILSFRSYAGTKENQKEYKAKLLSSISSLIDQIKVIIPNCTFVLTHQVDADLEFMKEIEMLLKEKEVALELVEGLITLENAKDYYGDTNLVFSNRLHVLLLAYKFGALPIAFTDLENHLKIKGIFEDSHLEKLLIDISTSELNNKINSIVVDRDNLVKKISKCAKGNDIKLKKIIKNMILN